MRFSFLFSALTLVAITVSLAGCATSGASPVTLQTPPLSTCGEPRPQVCTMIFAPVCATHANGDLHTHASGCNACADDQVAAYVDGACEDQGNAL